MNTGNSVEKYSTLKPLSIEDIRELLNKNKTVEQKNFVKEVVDAAREFLKGDYGPLVATIRSIPTTPRCRRCSSPARH